MTLRLTTNQVWTEIERNIFGVLGMVTAKGEARTAGIVYVVHDRTIYIGSEQDAWKVKHVAANPHVSLTIPIPKRVQLLPWIKIPAATITFSGIAKVLDRSEVNANVRQKLYIHEAESELCVIEVTPQNDFITYGVGIPLLQMRFPEQARGRAAVAA